jgi:hypothetical protein
LPERLLTRAQLAFALEDVFAELALNGEELVAGIPPSSRVGGFAANVDAAVDKISLNAILDTTNSLSQIVSSRFKDLELGCAEGRACAQAFVERFGRRAFRRELEADEVEGLLTRLFAPEVTFQAGIQQLVRGLFASADFLYHYETNPIARGGGFTATDLDLASQLSFLFWDSVPDEELLSLAQADRLRADGVLDQQIARLAASPRFDRNLERFFSEWLTKGNHADKDEGIFPELTDAVRSDAKQEVALFVSQLTRGGGRFSDLFTSRQTQVTAPLAKLYGLKVDSLSPAGDGWFAGSLPAGERAGLLTRVGFLQTTPAESRTSPTIRGRYLLGSLFCLDVQPPPPELQGFVTVPDDPTKSLRQRMSETTSQLPVCAGCHGLMDPIGFAFEHYDAIGRFRTQDGPVAIDASSEILDLGMVRDAVDLSTRLADRKDVRACFVRNWYRFAAHKMESAADDCSVQKLVASFAEDTVPISALVANLAKSPILSQRPAPMRMP